MAGVWLLLVNQKGKTSHSGNKGEVAGLGGPVLAERKREVGEARGAVWVKRRRERDRKLCYCPIGPPRGALRLLKG